MVRGTLFLEYEIREHGKIKGGAVIIMRMVLVDLERCGMCGVGIKVEVEVVLPDRAMLVTVHRPPDRGFVFSAIPHSGYFLNHVSRTAGRQSARERSSLPPGYGL